MPWRRPRCPGLYDSTGEVFVVPFPGAHGRQVVHYYVCDEHHLVPATLTVVIRAVEPVDVKRIAGRPGHLTVTNHNDKGINFWFGDRRAERPDGKVRIPAHATRVVRVQRHTIVWIALIGGGSAKGSLVSGPGYADHGVVRHIKLNRKPLPAPKRNGDLRSAGRPGADLPDWAPTQTR